MQLEAALVKDAHDRLESLFYTMKRKGQSLLFILHPDLQPEGYIDHYGYVSARRVLERLRIPYVEMVKIYQNTGRKMTDFSIDPAGNPHPNAEGHLLIAQTLSDFLKNHPQMLIRDTQD